MSQQLMRFEGAYSLRAIKDEHGDPWFSAKDVCTALNLDHTATRRLDADEKGLRKTQTLGGVQDVLFVSESGLYSLVLRSRKPEAKAFKRWVTHEVIPSIRKDGGYIAADTGETDEQIMARALRIADRAIVARDRRIAELEPKARFADAVADMDGTCLIADLAKILTQNGFTIGQNRLFEKLRRDGFLGSVGGHRNVPTQRAMEMGLFRIKETTFISSSGKVHASRTPKVTGKGQAYFLNRYCGARA